MAPLLPRASLAAALSVSLALASGLFACSSSPSRPAPPALRAPLPAASAPTAMGAAAPAEKPSPSGAVEPSPPSTPADTAAGTPYGTGGRVLWTRPLAYMGRVAVTLGERGEAFFVHSSGVDASDSTIEALDAQGRPLWKRYFGAQDDLLFYGPVPDGRGGFYLNGYFHHPLSLGGALLPPPSAGALAEGHFIAAFDSAGKPEVRAVFPSFWAGVLSEPTSTGLILIGSFDGMVKIDTHVLLPPAGAQQGYAVVKLKPSSGVAWATTLPVLDVGGHGVDAQGNVVDVGLRDRVVVARKLDAQGRLVWTRVFPWVRLFQVNAAVAPSGRIVLSGSLGPNAEHPVNFGTGSLGDDPDGFFVASLDADGRVEWVRTFVLVDPRLSNDAPALAAMAVDAQGSVVLVGSTYGEKKVTNSFPTGKHGALFVLELDAAGHHVWSRRVAVPDTCAFAALPRVTIAVDAISAVVAAYCPEFVGPGIRLVYPKTAFAARLARR